MLSYIGHYTVVFIGRQKNRHRASWWEVIRADGHETVRPMLFSVRPRQSNRYDEQSYQPHYSARQLQRFVIIQKLYMLILFDNRFGSSCQYENQMTAMKSSGMYVAVGLLVYFGIVAYTYDRLYIGVM
jgi:hypothetical protein